MTKTMQMLGLAFGQQLCSGLARVMEGGGWYLTLDREIAGEIQHAGQRSPKEGHCLWGLLEIEPDHVKLQRD